MILHCHGAFNYAVWYRVLHEPAYDNGPGAVRDCPGYDQLLLSFWRKSLVILLGSFFVLLYQ